MSDHPDPEHNLAADESEYKPFQNLDTVKMEESANSEESESESVPFLQNKNGDSSTQSNSKKVESSIIRNHIRKVDMPARFQALPCIMTYRPLECGDMPLVGFHMGGEIAGIRKLLLIVTSEPTLACDREGNVIKLPAGNNVVVAAEMELLQLVGMQNPTRKTANEVFIQPTNDEPIFFGSKASTFRYHVGVGREVAKEEIVKELFRLEQMKQAKKSG